MIHDFKAQRQFLEDGFLVVNGVVGSSEIEAINYLCDEEFAKYQACSRGENISNAKLYGLLDRDVRFRELASHPNLIPSLQNILGPNVVALKNRHNHVSLNRKGETQQRFHRDILNWSRGIVSAIVYLDKATEENGATKVIPGSHRLPFVGITQPNGGGTWMDEHAIYEGLEETAISVQAEAGDVLLFDGTLFHTVGQNITELPRRSIALGYRSVDELDPSPNLAAQMLVAGEWAYRGNDIAETLSPLKHLRAVVEGLPNVPAGNCFIGVP